MSYGIRRGFGYFRCPTRNKAHYDRSPQQCDQSKGLNELQAVSWISVWLLDVVSAPDIDKFFAEDSESALDHTAALQREIDDLQAQIDQMIVEQRLAKTLAVRESYRRQIDQAGEALEAKQRALGKIDSRAADRERELRHATIEKIRDLGDTFWSLPDRQINQMLHSLLGRWRFRVRDGTIVGREIWTGRNMRR